MRCPLGLGEVCSLFATSLQSPSTQWAVRGCDLVLVLVGAWARGDLGDHSRVGENSCRVVGVLPLALLGFGHSFIRGIIVRPLILGLDNSKYAARPASEVGLTKRTTIYCSYFLFVSARARDAARFGRLQ
jgi:hypothetical protein